MDCFISFWCGVAICLLVSVNGCIALTDNTAFGVIQVTKIESTYIARYNDDERDRLGQGLSQNEAILNLIEQNPPLKIERIKE
jgi:hypothetical protein